MAKRIATALSILIGMGIILFINWPGVVRPPATLQRVDAETSTAPAFGIGGPFTLTDANGNRVTESALLGHYSLVFFGFTHCPDICPTTLQKMTEAIESAGAAGEKVLPVFITVDPANDTPDVMKAYVANFHPRFLALTGSPEELQQAQKAYKVYAKESTNKGGIVHSDVLYLMGPDGKFITRFSADGSVQDLAAALKNVVKTS
jgi:protein SCO1/2